MSTKSSSSAPQASPSSLAASPLPLAPSPILATSPTSPKPPSYKPPNSSDLAYLAALPTPTVRQLVKSPKDHVTGSSTDQQSPKSAADGASDTAISAAAPSVPDPENPTSDPFPQQPHSSLLPPHAVLSSARRDWEGVTAQGVKIHRRDTWVVGQGWGRHMRVIEGRGPRRANSGVQQETGKGGRLGNEGNRGFEGGEVRRHRSW